MSLLVYEGGPVETYTGTGLARGTLTVATAAIAASIRRSGQAGSPFSSSFANAPGWSRRMQPWLSVRPSPANGLWLGASCR